MAERRYEIVDLFAGPGGWDEGAKSLGLSSVGVEIDRDACATAERSGHPRICADVNDVDLGNFNGWTKDLLLASPPCVAFSRLNKGHSRKHVDELVDAVLAEDWDWGKGRLSSNVLLPLAMGRWIDAFKPENIAFEQVLAVRPVWEAYEKVLTTVGYWVWTGELNASDYGTPQHRKRAVLMASRTHPVEPPTPTHGPQGRMPYVNAGTAMGWTSSTVRNPAKVNDQSGTKVDLDWPFKRPSLTIAGRNLMPHPGANANRFNGATKSRNDGFILSEGEMAVLQGFRWDYPFQGGRGSRQKQIGNAVPPQLAAAVINSLVSSSPLGLKDEEAPR